MRFAFLTAKTGVSGKTCCFFTLPGFGYTLLYGFSPKMQLSSQHYFPTAKIYRKSPEFLSPKAFIDDDILLKKYAIYR